MIKEVTLAKERVWGRFCKKCFIMIKNVLIVIPQKRLELKRTHHRQNHDYTSKFQTSDFCIFLINNFPSFIICKNKSHILDTNTYFASFITSMQISAYLMNIASFAYSNLFFQKSCNTKTFLIIYYHHVHCYYDRTKGKEMPSY